MKLKHSLFVLFAMAASACSLLKYDFERKYEQDAINGDAHAQVQLAWNYIEIARDDEKAFYWYQQAANQGDSGGQYNVAVMYDFGKGRPANYEKAAYWYKKAIEKNHPKALNNLGVLYANGLGVTKNDELATKLYQLASLYGNTVATHNLAWREYEGKGIKQNKTAAYFSFMLACKEGYQLSCDDIKRLYGK